MKNLIFMFGGLVVGGIGGFLAGKFVYKDKILKQAEEINREQAEWCDQQIKNIICELGGDVEEPENEVNPISERPDKDVIRERLKRNYEKTTDYANMYHKKEKNDEKTEVSEENVVKMGHKTVPESASESEKDDTGELSEDNNDSVGLTEEELAELENEDIQNERKRNRGRAPKIISADSLGDIPAYYDYETLFFYVLDETVTDEQDNVIENPERFIGDALYKYNFADNDDESTIYVRNFDLDTIYEVTKFNKAYFDV